MNPRNFSVAQDVENDCEQSIDTDEERESNLSSPSTNPKDTNKRPESQQRFHNFEVSEHSASLIYHALAERLRSVKSTVLILLATNSRDLTRCERHQLPGALMDMSLQVAGASQSLDLPGEPARVLDQAVRRSAMAGRLMVQGG